VDEYRRFVITAPVDDDLANREAYARRMLERAVIADVGRRRGLEHRPEVRAFVGRARKMAIRRGFLQQEIGATIPDPSEDDIREAFRRANTRLRLQQIFAGTKREADSLHRSYSSGISFDTLASRSMRDRGIDTGPVPGDMGWVSWNDMDLAPEQTAFSLEHGEVSEPVESLVGWHIFRLLDRKETVRLDATAYQSRRDRLAFEWKQRRFDEASARSIRRIIHSHELATDTRTLLQVWRQIRPAIPASATPPPLLLDYELARLDAAEIDRSTVVAWVDHAPFTIGQFLDQLPDVPQGYWTADLRPALEIAIRDSLLTAAALEEGYRDDAEVSDAAESALLTALYYATLKEVSDTLNVSRVRKSFYDEHKDRLFVEDFRTHYIAWLFADSLDARDAIRSAGNDAFGDLSSGMEQRTEDTGNPRLPIAGRLPISTTEDRVLAGPFREDSVWIVVEPVDRVTRYIPRDSVDIDLFVQSSWMEVVHKAALPSEYRSADAVVHHDRLGAALPMSNP
jgi:hypothetical protein